MLAIIDLHVHESCMHVAVRVLHSCAFIILLCDLHGFIRVFLRLAAAESAISNLAEFEDLFAHVKQ